MKKVFRVILSSKNALLNFGSAISPEIPDGFAIRTPPESCYSCYSLFRFANLPWFKFEEEFNMRHGIVQNLRPYVPDMLI